MSASSVAPPPANGRPVNEVKKRAFELFGDRRSIMEVAKELDRAESTTKQYLLEFLGRERETDPTPWVTLTNYRRVYNALLETDSELLRPVFERLGEEVPYEEIRIVRICVGNGGRPEEVKSQIA